MFQWVSHGTENIGNHVDNNHQRANHHHSGGDRRVVLLANGVDQPAAQSRQLNTISVIIAVVSMVENCRPRRGITGGRALCSTWRSRILRRDTPRVAAALHS